MADMRVLGTCKSEVAAYAVLASTDSPFVYQATCRTAEGARVPATVHPVVLEPQRAALVGDGGASNAEHVWAVAVPLLSCELIVSVGPEGESADALDIPIHPERPAAPTKGRIERRLGGLLRRLEARPGQPAAADRLAAVPGIEYRDWTGRTRVTVTHILPAGDADVWRLEVVYATDDGEASPRLSLLDEHARPIEASPIIMEDHVVPAAFDLALSERFVTFSVRLPRGGDHVVAVASLDAGHGAGQVADPSRAEGFACMTPEATRRLRDSCAASLVDVSQDPGYEGWLDVRRATPRDLEQQRAMARALGDAALSLGVVVVMDPRHDGADAAAPRADVGLQATRDTRQETPAEASLASQCYERYDRVTVSAEDLDRVPSLVRGDYLVYVHARDELEPDALWRLAEEVTRHPGTDLLYADEDHVRGGHYAAPDFKTFPNLGRLRAYDYLGDVLCVSRAVAEAAGPASPGTAPAWDYDLALRCFEHAEAPAHVARVLCHVHEEATSGADAPRAVAHEAGRRALECHLARCHTAATVDDGPIPCSYRVRYALLEPVPHVSIVIPSKDHASLLRACVESILERSTYPSYDIVIVENNSTEPATFELYRELEARDPRVRVVTWRPTGKTEGGFNYSAIVNFGACVAHGDYVVFLNNDTQVIEADWLEEMAGCLTRPEVAVVGAKLLFEDGLVQHAGMVANPNCDNAHINQNLWRDAPGYGLSAVTPSDMNMVTGACQMVRHAVFDDLGGYDENLAVGFNDSEFCLRVRAAGHAVAFTPYALLYHREFSSRGREVYDARMRQRLLAEKAYVMAKYPGFYAQGDDTVNENLDRFSLYFRL